MYTFHSYIQMLEQRIRYLEDRVLLTEKQLQLLKETSQQSPVHIDNITYKVQELAVNELSGTLHLGLTALSDPKQIDEWMKHSEEGVAQNIVLENLQSDTKEEA